MTDGVASHRVTRRAFLQTAAAGAAAAPFILPASARGASDRVALGVIGTGGRGTSVMRSFLPLDDLAVVAVCDCQKDRREKARRLVAQQEAERTGSGEKKGPAAVADFREVLARDDVDAVLLAPQDHWHAPMVVRAAAAGKDIYCEKPLGCAVAESQAIRDAVRRYGCVFQTGTQQRSSRNFRHASELARSGYLGKVHTVKVAAPGPRYQPKYDGPTSPQPVPDGFTWDLYVGPAPERAYNPGLHAWPDWYLIWDYCDGFIVNWGVHHLDIAHWGCPAVGREPFTLTCTGAFRTKGFTDNISDWQGEFRFASGLRMLFSDTGHPHEQGCRFEGEEGWVHVNRKGIHAEPASLLTASMKPTDERLHASAHHQADFVKAVRSRGRPVAPVEAGHVASTLGFLGEVACRVKRPIQWDWSSERITNDPAAARLLARPMRSPWQV